MCVAKRLIQKYEMVSKLKEGVYFFMQVLITRLIGHRAKCQVLTHFIQWIIPI